MTDDSTDDDKDNDKNKNKNQEGENDANNNKENPKTLGDDNVNTSQSKSIELAAESDQIRESEIDSSVVAESLDSI